MLHTVERRRVRGHDAEDVRLIRAAGNEQRLLKLPTKSSRDEILTVLY